MSDTPRGDAIWNATLYLDTGSRGLAESLVAKAKELAALEARCKVLTKALEDAADMLENQSCPHAAERARAILAQTQASGDM